MGGQGERGRNHPITVARNLKSTFILPFSINSIDLLPSNYHANLSTSFQYRTGHDCFLTWIHSIDTLRFVSSSLATLLLNTSTLDYSSKLRYHHVPTLNELTQLI